MKFLLLLTLSTLLLLADLKPFKTLSLDFTQVITNEQNRTLTYTGKLHMQQPNRILWEYETPVVKKIYIANSQVTIYEPDLLQATIFKNGRELNPIHMFNESTKIDENTRSAKFNQKEILIKHNKDEITNLSFLDEVENSVVIYFKSYQYNPTFNKSFFVFYPDSETDVIRP
jgi:outer membrane lipoprotein carrier protein